MIQPQLNEFDNKLLKAESGLAVDGVYVCDGIHHQRYIELQLLLLIIAYIFASSACSIFLILFPAVLNIN